MIVVTTPTGQIGSQVVSGLLAAGEPVRVIARDASRLPEDVRDRVEVIEGSHGDAAVLDRALAGADALFWVIPPTPRAESMEALYLDWTKLACEAIRRHGVGHVVDVTALGRGTPWQDRAGLVSVSLKMDELLAETGAAHRGLAMPGFMDNTLMQLDTIRNQGLFFGPIDSNRKLPACATKDIAAVAVRLLTDRSWSGTADVPVLGPEDLSFDEMAATMSDVLGKPVRYQQVPFEGFEGQLRQSGMSDDFVRGFVAMMRAKNEGADNAQPRTPEGTTPTTYRQWCEEVLKPAVNRA